MQSKTNSFLLPLVMQHPLRKYIKIRSKRGFSNDNFNFIRRQAKEIAKLDYQPANYQSNEQETDDFQKKNGSVISELMKAENKIESKMQFIFHVKSQKKIEKRRSKDKKAIKTLGIIMGIFIFCWLPFFLMYLMVPIVGVTVPILLDRIITWVGYVNSFINPIVYALTNRDFRKAYIATLKGVFKCCVTSDDDRFGNSFNHSRNEKTWLQKVCCCCCQKSKQVKAVPKYDFNNNNNRER